MPKILEIIRSSVDDDYQTDFLDPGPSKDFLYDDDYNHIHEQNFCWSLTEITSSRYIKASNEENSTSVEIWHQEKVRMV